VISRRPSGVKPSAVGLATVAVADHGILDAGGGEHEEHERGPGLHAALFQPRHAPAGPFLVEGVDRNRLRLGFVPRPNLMTTGR
jgi:hypothetical protein